MKKRLLLVGEVTNKIEAFIEQVQGEGHEVIVASKVKYKKHMTIDLSNPKNIKSFVKAFNQRYAYLDGLVFIDSMMTDDVSLTPQGYNPMMAYNFIGPLLLSEALKATLKTEEHARIIFLGSSTIFTENTIDLSSDLKGLNAYLSSKLSLLKYALYLSDELKDDHVTVNMLAENKEEQGFFKRLMKKHVIDVDLNTLYDLLFSEAYRYKTGKFIEGHKILALPQEKLNNKEVKDYIKGVLKEVK